MQRFGILAVVLAAPGVGSSRLVQKEQQQPLLAHYPEDVESCSRKLNQFITDKDPEDKAPAIRKLVNYCYESEDTEARTTVCPHLERAVTDGLWKVPYSKLLTPEKFCTHTEAHLTELQGVARVPRVASGKIHEPEAQKDCEPTVLAALDGSPSILSPNVPDFWYALCLNQDCAHMLPSRTKWCSISRPPTHSAAVCVAARTFAVRQVSEQKPYHMKPAEVCQLFSSFHKEMATDVAAYRHVVHGDPFPSQYIKYQEPSRGWWFFGGAVPNAGRPLLWSLIGPAALALLGGAL